MFNVQRKKEAMLIRNRELEQYNELYSKLLESCGSLYEVRRMGEGTIGQTEELINSIAKTPKRFVIRLKEVKRQKQEFKKAEECIEENRKKLAKTGVSMTVGLGMGAALAAAAKSGTKFLGSRAVLALTGPLGWGIVVALAGVSAFMFGKENEAVAEQIEIETGEIIKQCFTVKSFRADVEDLMKRTKLLQEKTEKLYGTLQIYNEWSYRKLPFWIKFRFGVLVNCTLALAELLNREL